MTEAGSEGFGLETLDTLVKFKMPRETAELVKRRFAELSRDGAGVSYMDCVLFDAALAVLGEEQSYYGLSDAEWADILKERAKRESGYAEVKTVEIAADGWQVSDNR